MSLPTSQAHQESREANRRARDFLESHVRNDWCFPALDEQDGRSSSSGQPPDVSSLPPLSWRSRRYSFSLSANTEHGLVTHAGSVDNALPDAVADFAGLTFDDGGLDSKSLLLMRKHDEECDWNSGLAHFSARRNAWTGARRGSYDQQRSSSERRVQDATASSESASEQNPDAPAHSEHTLMQGYDKDTGAIPEGSVLLPVPAAILQDHPLRTKDIRAGYGDIYHKIIVQARTPSIPINLAQMTNALVHGWKGEGNWPPKESAPEEPLTRKKILGELQESSRAAHIRKKAQAVGRALRLG